MRAILPRRYDALLAFRGFILLRRFCWWLVRVHLQQRSEGLLRVEWQAESIVWLLVLWLYV